MIRFILSAVMATATLTGLTLAPVNAADPPRQQRQEDRRDRNDRNDRNDRDGRYDRHDRHGRFEVFYKHRGHWDKYGGYRERDDAQRAARQLRQRGFEVRVDRD